MVEFELQTSRKLSTSLSVPLFWSQSSTLTDMKPAPKLDRPVAQTIPTTRLHFDQLKQTYGPQVRLSLYLPFVTQT